MSKAVIHCKRCGTERLLSPSHARARKYCSPQCGFAARTEASRRESGTSAAHWHRPDRIKRCIRCGERKLLGEFDSFAYTTRQGRRSRRYNSRCKSCRVAYDKERRDAEPEKQRAMCRRWYAANTEQQREYRKRRQQDPAHRVNKAKAQRLRTARMRSGQPNTPEIRAIYAQAMREEALIQCCPVFDIPELGKKLHVDHIIPLARGGRHEAANLQILPAGINCRKWAL